MRLTIFWRVILAHSVLLALTVGVRWKCGSRTAGQGCPQRMCILCASEDTPLPKSDAFRHVPS